MLFVHPHFFLFFRQYFMISPHMPEQIIVSAHEKYITMTAYISYITNTIMYKRNFSFYDDMQLLVKNELYLKAIHALISIIKLILDY